MESRCPSCSGLRWPSYDSAGSASFAFPTYTDFCNCRSRYDQQPTGSEDFTCAGLLGRTRGSSGYAMSNYELCTPQAFPEAVQPQGPEEEVLCIEVMPVQADGTEITGYMVDGVARTNALCAGAVVDGKGLRSCMTRPMSPIMRSTVLCMSLWECGKHCVVPYTSLLEGAGGL